MKRTMNRLMGISLLCLLLIAGAGQTARAQDVEVSFQAFYDNLAPYGQWVNDPEYGNVWVPNEEGNFRPYGSRGHWVMTEYGNTWVSEDPWGWACYHYGRWTYDSYYGWVWIPGYEWAPAWVSWRSSGTYCGWAPLGPGVGLSFACPESWWIFVGPQYLYHPDCFRYWRGAEYNRTYITQTTIINNYYSDNHTRVQYNYGPRREDIQRYTHQPVQVYRFNETNRAGASHISGQSVNMYRPRINQVESRGARPSNVYQASRPVGSPQAADPNRGNRPAAFRQEMSQRPAQNNNNGRDFRNNNPQQQGRDNRNNGQIMPQPGRGAINNNQQPVNREPQSQPQRNFNQPPTREPQQNNQPPVNREQPRNNYQPPVNRDQQREFQAPPRPQIHRDEPRQPPQVMPQRQPEPQRQPQMQPQRQPEPQRQQQMQPQPQRQQPQMQPQRQQPQAQPQPNRQQQVQPLHQAPGNVREGGRR